MLQDEINNSENQIDFDNVVIIGITGGIGSGKSEFCKVLFEHNQHVISTDDLAKKLISSSELVKSKIIDVFGSSSFDDKGIFNNKYISSLVFNPTTGSENLKKLNSIVHPPVIELMINEIEELVRRKIKLIFVESALMYESGLDEGFDYIITITANDELRITRAMNRTGLSKDEVLIRMKEQISQEEKIRLSDFTIENNKSLDDLKKSAEFMLSIIKNLPPKNNYSSELLLSK